MTRWHSTNSPIRQTQATNKWIMKTQNLEMKRGNIFLKIIDEIPFRNIVPIYPQRINWIETMSLRILVSHVTSHELLRKKEWNFHPTEPMWKRNNEIAFDNFIEIVGAKPRSKIECDTISQQTAAPCRSNQINNFVFLKFSCSTGFFDRNTFLHFLISFSLRFDFAIVRLITEAKKMHSAVRLRCWRQWTGWSTWRHADGQEDTISHREDDLSAARMEMCIKINI